MSHRLDAPCPTCGHAQWMHTPDRCLKLHPQGRFTFTRCECGCRADDFGETA